MQIVKVETTQKLILKHLIALFLHDLSEFNPGQELNQKNGLFEFDEFEWFFEKDGLTPYFIIYDNHIVGFILIQSDPFINPELYDYLVNSFFILKKYRKRGIGKQAAHQLFQRLPGRYVIGQLSNNDPAIAFWKSVYHHYGVEYEEKEELDEGLIVKYQYFSV
ncbi:GNAT family N-acetyltransferase [Paenibacillus sp. YPG26]|uniref:GNAT family N-acetyltransferase n=1 Tax=Paenibacillus sp. YPG26 TaxID=2878915 RepID=UPI002040A900|nr:GNAT family N-acetyltransferase [Paenibacillus sp. YPG26]USB33391.1 GNAT family N-acetyltransferase [Paenibacillus sp. YPG26]